MFFDRKGKAIFVVGARGQKFLLQLFRCIVDDIGQMRKIKHFQVIEVISNAKGFTPVDAFQPANFGDAMGL